MKFRYPVVPILGLFLLVCAAPVAAQWRSDSTTHTPICTATGNQLNPKVLSDGADGFIIVWEDIRTGANWDIYAQKLNADGVPQWGPNGVPVCSFNFNQTNPVICLDDSGGFYCVWQDTRNSGNNGVDLYAQHIRKDGTRAYDTVGKAVVSTIRDQNVPAITSDGRGNAYVAWEDNRATQTSPRPDIYTNILTPTGIKYTNGRATIVASSQDKRPKLVPDGAGGCVLAWESNRQIPQCIRITRVDDTLGSRWGVDGIGLLVYKGETSNNISRNASITKVGNEVYLAWEVISTGGDADIYAYRVGINDTSRYWWSAPEVTGSWPGDQTNPRIVTDDSNGAFVAFETYAGDLPPLYLKEDIAAVRILPNGAERLPSFNDGFWYLAQQTRGQTGQRIVSVGDGSMIAVWNDARLAEGDSSIYAQRIDKRGNRLLGNGSKWGQAIAASPTRMEKQVAIAPRTNGAAIVWTDNRNGTFDIFAQLLFKNGTLPIELASFNARAIESGAVELNWKTASEEDNAGFEIERREIGGDFSVVSSFRETPGLRGAISSVGGMSYLHVDRPGHPGSYEYRLVDVDLSGLRTTHSSKRVEVSDFGTFGWGASPASPNPTRGGSVVLVTTAVPSTIEAQLTDVLGRTTRIPLGHYSAGEHRVEIPFSSLDRGAYLLRISASEDGGAPLWTSEKAQVVRIIK